MGFCHKAMGSSKSSCEEHFPLERSIGYMLQVFIEPWIAIKNLYIIRVFFFGGGGCYCVLAYYCE